jgi:hypothetical protein
MKDLTAFPSKTGFELVEKSMMMLGQDAIAENDCEEDDPYAAGSTSSDGIIEGASSDGIIEAVSG